jgi:hypothetical protein
MAIYSGQAPDDRSLPMPNIKIDLFMVAPDQRREKVAYEIPGPPSPA